jgi:hypothetical protein
MAGRTGEGRPEGRPKARADMLWPAARMQGLQTIAEIKAALESEPYWFPNVSYGYLGDIMRGDRPLPRHDLGAALLHRFGLELRDVGIDPLDPQQRGYKSVWTLLEYTKFHPWPQRGVKVGAA